MDYNTRCQIAQSLRNAANSLSAARKRRSFRQDLRYPLSDADELREEAHAHEYAIEEEAERQSIMHRRWAEEADRQWKQMGHYVVHAWLGAVIARDKKAVEVIASFVEQFKARSLTIKQVSYFKSLYRKVGKSSPLQTKEIASRRRALADRILVKYLKPNEVEIIEALNIKFEGSAFTITAVLPKPPKKVHLQPKSGQGNPEQLSALDGFLSNRSNTFIKSIRDQLAKGKKLSEKQLKAVRRSFYQARMRDKADLFRG